MSGEGSKKKKKKSPAERRDKIYISLLRGYESVDEGCAFSCQVAEC